MKIKAFEKIFGFKSKFSYYELSYIFRPGNLYIKIKNTRLLNLIRKLADLAYPDESDQDPGEKKVQLLSSSQDRKNRSYNSCDCKL